MTEHKKREKAERKLSAEETANRDLRNDLKLDHAIQTIDTQAFPTPSWQWRLALLSHELAQTDGRRANESLH
jgi:hypothetical protein